MSAVVRVGSGGRVVGTKVTAAADGGLAPLGLNTLCYRFNSFNCPLAVHWRHVLRLRLLRGWLLFDGNGFLLHGLAALSFD